MITLATCERKNGLTLVELLVVVVIIGTLVGLLLPAVQAARESARNAACVNKFKQIGVALSNHESAYGCFPMGSETSWRTTTAYPDSVWPDYAAIDEILAGPRRSALVLLLPYVEQDAVTRQYLSSRSGKATRPGPDGSSVQKQASASNPYDHQQPYISTVVLDYACPSDGIKNPKTGAGSTFATTNYGIVIGKSVSDAYYSSCKGMFGLLKRVRVRDVTDGTSKTMAMAELKAGSRNDWRGFYVTGLPGSSMVTTHAGPNTSVADVLYTGLCDSSVSENLPCSSTSTTSSLTGASRSQHPNGVNILLADGAVRFVDNNVDASSGGVWENLGYRSDGKTIGDY